MADDKTNSKPQKVSRLRRMRSLRSLRAISLFVASVRAWVVARFQSLWRALRRTLNSCVVRLIRFGELAASSSQRRAAYQSRAYYWRLLRIWSKIRFRSLSLYVRGRGSLSAKISSGRLLREFTRLSLSRIVISLVIVCTSVGIDRILLGQTDFWRPWFPGYYVNADFTLYASFFSTLAGIAAVLLGLYFTAVSVVASTGYANAPPILRSMLLREKVGNVYVTFVVLLGISSLILAVLCNLRIDPGVSSLLLVAILGCLSIGSFVILGWRVFYFFDPVALADQLDTELATSVRCVTPKRRGWRDASIQAHYQRLAEHQLTAYRKIADWANERPTAQSLKRLISGPLINLRAYARQKARIPSDSYWFRRKHEHPSWLTTDSASLHLALETGTCLQPKSTPHLNWFEDDCATIVSISLRSLLTNGELLVSSEALDLVRGSLRYMSRHYAASEAVNLGLQLGRIIDASLTERLPNSETASERLLRLAQLDVSGAFPIAAILGLVDALKERCPMELLNQVETINWKRPRSVFMESVPREVTQCLEWLSRSLDFERAAEGRIVTPIWYRKQQVGIAFAKGLHRIVRDIVNAAGEFYDRRAHQLTENGDVESATGLLVSGLEFCSKFRAHFDLLQESLVSARIGNWEQYPVALKLDLNAFRTQVKDLETRLLVQWARALPSLATLKRTDELPDYFGQGILVLARQCVLAMKNRDVNVFKSIFPVLVAVALRTYDSALPDLKDLDESRQLILASEAIVDVAELSGLAIAFSELDGREFGNIAGLAWDCVLDSHKDRDALCAKIATILNIRNDDIRLSPHSVLRTGWRQVFARELRERGLTHSPLNRSWHRGTDREHHSSALIRVLGQSDFMLPQMKDVFVVRYLTAGIKDGDAFLSGEAKRLKQELEVEVRGTVENEADDATI